MGIMSISNIIRAAARLWAARAGIATTEAAFIAPIFVLACLAVADLGFAGGKRMQLDQALRAGAQIAMINVNDTAEIETVALAALGETESGSKLDDGMCAPDKTCIDVTNECECDGSSASCDSLCPSSGLTPDVFMIIEASRRHEGLLFSDMNLQTKIVVQTR